MSEYRLLLLSLGLGAVAEFLDAPGATIAFVPTAGDPYEDPAFVRDDRRRLSELGYEVRDVDFATTNPSTLAFTLAHVDAIFVAGGNSFYLLQEIRRRGLSKTITNSVRAGLPYMGASAGAVVCGPSLLPLQSLDDPEKAPGLDSMEGLALTSFVPLPHYGKAKYLPLYNDVIDRYQGDFELVPLRDDQAAIVRSASEYEVVPSALVLQYEQ